MATQTTLLLIMMMIIKCSVVLTHSGSYNLLQLGLVLLLQLEIVLNINLFSLWRRFLSLNLSRTIQYPKHTVYIY